MFLLDVDNTLLDNDRVERDLRRHLEEGSGAEAAARYWETLDQAVLAADLLLGHCPSQSTNSGRTALRTSPCAHGFPTLTGRNCRYGSEKRVAR